jgi:hypothetical protein
VTGNRLQRTRRKQKRHTLLPTVEEPRRGDSIQLLQMAHRMDADTASARQGENKRSARTRTDYPVPNLGIQSRDQHHIWHHFDRRRREWQEQSSDRRSSTILAPRLSPAVPSTENRNLTVSLQARPRRQRNEEEGAGEEGDGRAAWGRQATGGGRAAWGKQATDGGRAGGGGGGARRASAGVGQRGRRERGTEWERRETSVLVGILPRSFLKNGSHIS